MAEQENLALLLAYLTLAPNLTPKERQKLQQAEENPREQAALKVG